MAIGVNTVGSLFWVGINLIVIWSFVIQGHVNYSAIPVSLFIFGLSPLIVTTYCLWYLNDPLENEIGVFAITPIAVGLHFFMLTLSGRTFPTLMGHGIEFIAAISFVVIGIRLGHVRNKPQLKADFA
jgi:hypothetical protein